MYAQGLAYGMPRRPRTPRRYKMILMDFSQLIGNDDGIAVSASRVDFCRETALTHRIKTTVKCRRRNGGRRRRRRRAITADSDDGLMKAPCILAAERWR